MLTQGGVFNKSYAFGAGSDVVYKGRKLIKMSFFCPLIMNDLIHNTSISS
jgi:hypothetical protein